MVGKDEDRTNKTFRSGDGPQGSHRSYNKLYSNESSRLNKSEGVTRGWGSNRASTSGRWTYKDGGERDVDSWRDEGSRNSGWSDKAWVSEGREAKNPWSARCEFGELQNYIAGDPSDVRDDAITKVLERSRSLLSHVLMMPTVKDEGASMDKDLSWRVKETKGKSHVGGDNDSTFSQLLAGKCGSAVEHLQQLHKILVDLNEIFLCRIQCHRKSHQSTPASNRGANKKKKNPSSTSSADKKLRAPPGLESLDPLVLGAVEGSLPAVGAFAQNASPYALTWIAVLQNFAALGARC